MSKKSDFVDWVNSAIAEVGEPTGNAAIYWETFKEKEENDKPKFTNNGKLILKFFQESEGAWKSKDIAESIGIASKSVSGSIRKLVNDGYVEKVGEDPVIYAITELGKNEIFED